MAAELLASQTLIAQRLEFDFARSDYGFASGFADYPTNFNPEYYQLTNDWRARPPYLGGEPALFVSGWNQSDDLFMFWKKRITDLDPGASYVLTMEIEFASKYATGLVGAGGAPGDHVALKTGATPFEPLAVVPADDTYFRMNLDKGDQKEGGTNMAVRGTIAKPDDGNENYVLLTRHHHGNPQIVTPANDGSLWLAFGTDSGFEGVTALYYTRLTVWLNRTDAPWIWIDRATPNGALRLIWNHGVLETSPDLSEWSPAVVTNRPHWHLPDSEPHGFWRVRVN